jgi:hypothetical protein
VSLGPVITANGLGQLPTAYQDSATAYRLILKDKLGAQLDGGDIDPFYFGLVAGVDGTDGIIVSTLPNAVSSRTLLAAISSPVNLQSATLNEAGREGTFVFSATNLSTMVTGDPAQGIFVAPASDTTGASGAWVRKYTGDWSIGWFGANPNDQLGAGTDCYVSILAMLSCAAAVGKARTNDSLFNGLIACELPGYYYCSAYFSIHTPVHLRGLSGGMQGVTGGTRLRFPAGSAGVVVCGANNTGYTTGSVATTTGADGTILQGITFLAGTGSRPTIGTAHGVFFRVRGTWIDCKSIGFSGHGLAIIADTGGTPFYGNANGCHIRGGAVTNNGDCGFYVQGSDVNAGDCIGLDTYGNGRWGKYIKPFLNFSCLGGQEAGNGVAAYVCYPAGGQVYSVIVGQETAASTTTPGTNSAIWQPLVGTTSGSYTTWTSGMTVISGGSIYLGAGTYTEPYAEGSQGYAQIASGAICIGGLLGASNQDYIGPRITMGLGTLRTNSLTSSWSTGTASVDLMAAQPHFLRFQDTTDLPSRMIWALSGHDLLQYYSSTSNLYAQFTGPSTTAQFGTGAAYPYATYNGPNLMIGSSASTARKMTNGTVAPTTGAHGKGEIVWNQNMTVGSPIGWACTVAGTPGTWVAMANL